MTAHLWRNVKVQGTIKYRDFGGPLTHSVGFSAVAGDAVMVRRQTRFPVGGPPEPESAAVITPDQAVRFERTADGAGWRVWRQVIPWDASLPVQPDLYYDTLGGGPPLDYPVPGPYIGHGPNAYFRPSRRHGRDAVSVRRDRYAGQEVVEVRTTLATGRYDLDRLVRVRAADGLVTTVEEHGMVRREEFVPTRHVFDVSYRPALAGELPFPAAIRSRLIEPDGTELPGVEVTFTEYRRYTPMPDELDPVRLFGLPLPDAGPRPPLPRPGEYRPDRSSSRTRSDRPSPGRRPPPPVPAAGPDRSRLLLGGLVAGGILAGGLAAARRRR